MTTDGDMGKADKGVSAIGGESSLVSMALPFICPRCGVEFTETGGFTCLSCKQTLCMMHLGRKDQSKRCYCNVCSEVVKVFRPWWVNPLFARALRLAILVFAVIGAAYLWLPVPVFTTCEVHHTLIWHGPLPVAYGFIAGPTQEYMEGRKKEFPNARSFIGGGCVIGVPTPKRAYYCRSCNKAEKEWEKTHKKYSF